MSPIDNSNIQTNTAPKKRGRKSKKEIELALQSQSIENINVVVEDNFNDKSNINDIIVSDTFLSTLDDSQENTINDENIFCRQQQTYPETLQDEWMSKSEELVTEVTQLSFSYCYLDNASGDYKWKEEWVKEEQDTIPQAVKIELIFKDKSGKESILTKTIFIPIGTGEQKIELGGV